MSANPATAAPFHRLAIAGVDDAGRVIPEEYRPHLDAFWAQVVESGSCWLYTGTPHGDGYAVYHSKGFRRYAHRMAYEICIGPIPEGHEVDHVAARGCTHRNCVNPTHLEAVIPIVNKMRSRSFCAVNAQKTHCAQGHEFTPENTYIWRAKNYVQRKCLTCKREGNRRYYARRTATKRGGA